MAGSSGTGGTGSGSGVEDGGGSVVGGGRREGLAAERDGGFASEDRVGQFGFGQMERTEELAEIVKEVSVTAKHAAPIVCVFVVEEEMGGRTVVETFGDFLRCGNHRGNKLFC